MGSLNGNGDERPPHLVRISRGFEMGKYEVTQVEWEALMGSNPSRFKSADRPVENVSWDDVQRFIRKLNAKSDGFIYRLPTEAEWEYACRAGTTGDYAGSLDDMGWYERNSNGQTHPVGQKRPNAWGLYDMHGNVWEWVQDWFGPYDPSMVTDPHGPASAKYRTNWGGGWSFWAAYCRSAKRDGDAPGDRGDRSGFLGFRLVRTAK